MRRLDTTPSGPWIAALALALAGVLCAAPAVARPADPPQIAIVGVNLIDGTGGEVRRGVSVRLRGDRIVEIGPVGPARAGETVIDGRGKFLLPGFVDTNVHATVYGTPARRDTSVKYGDRNEALALEFAQRHLKYGVTTIRDSYGVLPAERAVRDRIASGAVVGPRLLVAGNILGWGGPFSLTFSLTPESELSVFQEQWNDLVAQEADEDLLDMTPDELRGAVNRYLDKGVDFIKYGGTSHFRAPSLIGFSPRAQAVLLEEAHRRGRLVDTHATSPEALRIALEAGVDLVQHPEILSRDYPDDLIELIVRKQAFCALRPNMLTGAKWEKIQKARSEAETKLAGEPAPLTGAQRRRRDERLMEPDLMQRRNAERLIRAGCRVTIGTDNYLGDAPEFRRAPKGPEQEPGVGTLLAIEGLVELGMTPMQAIIAATRNGAEASGLPDAGTIAIGKLADLVLLDEDPTENIHAIWRISMVFARGQVVDRDRLPETTLFGAKDGLAPPPSPTVAGPAAP